MAEFTLLKLQVDDASLSAKMPFSGSDDGDVEGEDDEESSSVLPILLGLVFLIVVAVVAKKLLGRRSSDLEEVSVDAE